MTGGDSVVASTTTFANLEPGCNDIDVGAATGAPLGAATAGASLGVAVRFRQVGFRLALLTAGGVRLGEFVDELDAIGREAIR